MFENDLKVVYRSAKDKGMALFNKIAVGEVRDAYHKQLKEKFTEKHQYFVNENEKVSEQQCLNFLHHHYESIN